MSRRDDVTKLYKPSEYLGKAEKILFAVDIIAAFVSLIPNSVISSVAISIQILVALLYFICNTIDDGCFWYEAEKQRRKNGIQNGLGHRLSEYETDGYYNNSTAPSLEKYGLNILESNFFSKCIAQKMILKSSICALLSIVALVFASIYLENINALLVIAQTTVSSYILVDLVMLVIYKQRLNVLYDDAYNMMIRMNHIDQAWLISYIVEYEAVKAHYKIRLDSKIFEKYNDELSQQWQSILNHRAEQQDS